MLKYEHSPTLWFYRRFDEMTGGHLKHSHYFEHTKLSGIFNPALYLNPASGLPKNDAIALWKLNDSNCIPCWAPAEGDAFFIAGEDWQYAMPFSNQFPMNPIINLIQGVRHADPKGQLYQFLGKRAIRICVSKPVAEAINATGKVNGPVVVIENGIDIAPANQKLDFPSHPSIGVLAYKNRYFGRLLVEKLKELGIEYEIYENLLPRPDYLHLLGRHRLLVCLPLAEEGFYLTGLEAMSQGAITVVPDCRGNLAYAQPNSNCFVPAYELDAVVSAVLQAYGLPSEKQKQMSINAIETAHRFSIAREREQYTNLLSNLNALW